MRLSTEQAALALAFAVALAGGGVAIHFKSVASAQQSKALGLALELGETRAALEQARHRTEVLTGKATELDNQLGSAKTRSTATEARSVQLNRELNSLRSTVGERDKREVALLAEIESLRQQIASFPAQSQEGQSAPHVQDTRGRIASLEAQLSDLLTRSLVASIEPHASTAQSPTVVELRHQVVRVGNADAFVIINFGSAEGATVGREAVLVRGTFAVARVKISDVRTRFSVAQVLPPHKGQLQTGDIVLLAQ